VADATDRDGDKRDQAGDASSVAGAGQRPGLREALLVGAGVVAAVLLAAALTWAVPDAVRDIVFRTPLLIGVLIVGTGVVLWWITRPTRPGPADPRDR
jgi:hypothetical protein